MKLIIDTTQHNVATFTLSDGKKNSLSQKKFAITESFQFERGHNDRTLTFLERFLKKNKIKPSQLATIQAYSGPGSYTGVRVGATIAQALGFAWGVPVTIIKKK